MLILFAIDEIKKCSYIWIKEQFGKLDYAMNNAGFGIPAKPLLDANVLVKKSINNWNLLNSCYKL